MRPGSETPLTHDEQMMQLGAWAEELQAETDRGAALVGAAMVDDRLSRLLHRHFLDTPEAEFMLEGPMAPLGTFSARTYAAFCLGLITRVEFEECRTIRKIRNEFAHALHGLKFTDQRIYDLCNNLKANRPGYSIDGNARGLFVNSVILTSTALWYRPEWAAPYRACERRWDNELSTGYGGL